MTCRSKIAKIIYIGSVGRHGRQLENLFFTSSPEQKGQLARNFIESIGDDLQIKNTAKIVPIEIQDGRYDYRPSLESIFYFS